MEKKLVLEELYRMRELMGITILSESTKSTISNLLMEGGKTVDNIIGLSPRTVDNLTKNGVDFANDLTRLSDEFATRNIKTFADLTNAVAISKGLDPKNITDEMIESYIKNDKELYQSILKKATQAGANTVDNLIKNVDLERLFSDNLDQLQTYKQIFTIEPDANNVDDIIDQLNLYINELDNTVDLLQRGGKTVPDELVGLIDELIGKKTDLDNFKLSNETFKNRGTSTPSEEEPYIPPIFDDGVEDIVEDLSTPIEKLLGSIKNRDSIKKRLGGISDDAISDIEANLKSRYGTLTPEQMIKYMGQAESDFLTLIKREEDELNELIKKGNEEDILKKQKYIEGLKKAWKLMYDNIFTRGCVGKSTSAVKGQIKSTIEFQGGKSFLKSTGCLFAGYLAYDILQWLNTDKKDREFVSCPVLTFFGGCETYTSYGLCLKSCGGDSSTSSGGGIGKTKTKADGEAFINSMNGPGQDLETLTLTNWVALGDEVYGATLSNGQVVNLRWDGNAFVPQ
jgi:hypothetical protein